MLYVILLQSLFFLVFRYPYLWLVRIFQSHFLSPLDKTLVIVLLLDRARCFRLLFTSLPQTWNQTFLQGTLIPFSEKYYLETAVWAKWYSLNYHCFKGFSVFSSRAKVFLRKRKINHDDILIFLNLKKRIWVNFLDLIFVFFIHVPNLAS